MMIKKNKPLELAILRYGSLVLLIFGCGFMMTGLFANQYPLLWSMSLLSCVMGMQHAFDVDHLAVIDNISRKLINEKRTSMGVGFYFSFGHSLVVLLMTVILLLFVEKIKRVWPSLAQTGGIVSSIFAGCVLILLAAINLVLMHQIWGEFKNHKLKAAYKDTKSYQRFLNLLKLIDHNWQIVLVGFLFGLGFDTATQIGMLAISAMTVEKGVPIYAILAFPLLFTAGMCLWDTIDGFIVGSAYKWVYDNPLRKVVYNLILTGLSVIAALLTGLVSLINAGQQFFNWKNGFVLWIGSLNFFQLGLILAGVFLSLWLVILIHWHKLKAINN